MSCVPYGVAQELLRHNMRENVEDDIFYTAGMAICLGVVQRYGFEKVRPIMPEEGPLQLAVTATVLRRGRPRRRGGALRRPRAQRSGGEWRLQKRAWDLDDEAEMFGGEAAEAAARMEGLLLAKETCLKFAEELQMEVSEVGRPLRASARTCGAERGGVTPPGAAGDVCGSGEQERGADLPGVLWQGADTPAPLRRCVRHAPLAGAQVREHAERGARGLAPRTGGSRDSHRHGRAAPGDSRGAQGQGEAGAVRERRGARRPAPDA